MKIKFLRKKKNNKTLLSKKRLM